jgi:hypothetical protein
MWCYEVLFVCSYISGPVVFYLLLKGLLVALFLLCYCVFSCFICKFCVILLSFLMELRLFLITLFIIIN